MQADTRLCDLNFYMEYTGEKEQSCLLWKSKTTISMGIYALERLKQDIGKSYTLLILHRKYSGDNQINSTANPQYMWRGINSQNIIRMISYIALVTPALCGRKRRNYLPWIEMRKRKLRKLVTWLTSQGYSMLELWIPSSFSQFIAFSLFEHALFF